MPRGSAIPQQLRSIHWSSCLSNQQRMNRSSDRQKRILMNGLWLVIWSVALALNKESVTPPFDLCRHCSLSTESQSRAASCPMKVTWDRIHILLIYGDDLLAELCSHWALLSCMATTITVHTVQVNQVASLTSGGGSDHIRDMKWEEEDDHLRLNMGGQHIVSRSPFRRYFCWGWQSKSGQRKRDGYAIRVWRCTDSSEVGRNHIWFFSCRIWGI